ncbi:MAG: hypothetical protein JEZ11_11395 [Desulfobacterales bacterium]|nr:hypothetical protein [Desulfobacterales bacterium]
MEEKCIFNCETCNGTTEINTGEPHDLPECCGKPMKRVEPMDQCLAPPSAEHARFDDDSEPCDDGRSG